MSDLILTRPTLSDRSAIEAYRAEFLPGRARVTFDPARIPGMDHLEACGSVEAWLRFMEEMKGKISWFMSVRPSDRRPIGFLCLRHRLEYDDDDPEFCSHIGYSIRPSEQGKGFGREQLRLGLIEAGKLGLHTVRAICVETNVQSAAILLSLGGVYLDTLRGEESGLNVRRYDLPVL